MSRSRFFIVTTLPLLGCLLILSPRAALAEAESESDVEAAGQPGEAETSAAEPEVEPDRPYGRAGRVADFAPAGVYFAETHRKRDWSFFYEYQRIQKKGLNDNGYAVGPVQLAASNYTTIPGWQTDNWNTVGVMYTPHERLSFALSLPYIERRMQLTDEEGTKEYRTAGIGDARLMFMLPFITKGRERTQVNIGLSFPTGSIQEQDINGDRLPYAMQLGSGSWDLLWGMTYAGQSSIFSWGTQFEGIYRIADNSVGYRLGSVYHASGWFAGNLGSYVNASVRLLWTRNGNIRGEDPYLDLTKGTNPLNDNKRQAGTHVELGPGITVLLPFLGKQKFSFEVIWPIYENLDGPQLAGDVRVVGSYQWIF